MGIKIHTQKGRGERQEGGGEEEEWEESEESGNGRWNLEPNALS